MENDENEQQIESGKSNPFYKAFQFVKDKCSAANSHISFRKAYDFVKDKCSAAHGYVHETEEREAAFKKWAPRAITTGCILFLLYQGHNDFKNLPQLVKPKQAVSSQNQDSKLQLFNTDVKSLKPNKEDLESMKSSYLNIYERVQKKEISKYDALSELSDVVSNCSSCDSDGVESIKSKISAIQEALESQEE